MTSFMVKPVIPQFEHSTILFSRSSSFRVLDVRVLSARVRISGVLVRRRAILVIHVAEIDDDSLELVS